MRHIALAIFILIFVSTKAMAGCGEPYLKKLDYLKGTETIAVQVETIKTADGKLEKLVESLVPKMVDTIASQIPKYSTISVINYLDANNAQREARSTTIFKFVIDSIGPLPILNLYMVHITFYLANFDQSKSIAHKGVNSIPLPSDDPAEFLRFIKILTQETVTDVICLKDNVCPPPEKCKDDIQPKFTPKEFPSDEYMGQRMKDLE